MGGRKTRLAFFAESIWSVRSTQEKKSLKARKTEGTSKKEGTGRPRRKKGLLKRLRRLIPESTLVKKKEVIFFDSEYKKNGGGGRSRRKKKVVGRSQERHIHKGGQTKEVNIYKKLRIPLSSTEKGKWGSYDGGGEKDHTFCKEKTQKCGIKTRKLVYARN